MANLNGKDLENLVKVLSSALSFADLEDFVYASIGEELYVEFVGRGQPLKYTINALLTRLQQRGELSAFLAYVYVRRQKRDDVKEVIARLFPEATAVPDTSTNAIVPGLQRSVRLNLAYLDITAWQTRLGQIKSQVCRMEMDGNAVGTGFLVGPDTVLTAWHVFEVANKVGDSDRMSCRFGYEVLLDGTARPGQLFKLQAGGCIDSSPYSAAEAAGTPDNPLPTPAELDYALLRLADRVGEQQVDGAARGWITLPKAVLPLSADSPILTVQHPEGMPMKLAMDTQALMGLNANGTRIRYRTRTAPGSGGSPVFTMNWDIVALHHYRDPNWMNPTFRQGVPIELIRQRIDGNGFGAALGA